MERVADTIQGVKKGSVVGLTVGVGVGAAVGVAIGIGVGFGVGAAVGLVFSAISRSKRQRVEKGSEGDEVHPPTE